MANNHTLIYCHLFVVLIFLCLDFNASEQKEECNKKIDDDDDDIFFHPHHDFYSFCLRMGIVSCLKVKQI